MDENRFIKGSVAPGFEPVREAFAELFATGGELGAAFTAHAGGRRVADLAGGRVGLDDLVCVYSAGKPLAAFCALVLVDRGALELDAPVADVWPEFAAGGKSAATVRHALAHQAGVLGWRAPQPVEALLDWERAVALVAAEEAWWPPGTAHGEHALLYGHLAGELVRRVDGRSLGAFWREEVAGPWGLDVHFGLHADEQARVVDLVDPDGAWAGGLARYHPAVHNPPALGDLAVVNSPAWRSAEVPAVNAHATARGIARFYAGLLAGGELDGVRLLGERTVAEMVGPQASGRDELLGEDVTWGLGVMLADGGWGMGGVGGSLGWADPGGGYAAAYVTCRMGDHDRAEAIEQALTRCLAAS